MIIWWEGGFRLQYCSGQVKVMVTSSEKILFPFFIMLVQTAACYIVVLVGRTNTLL
jgi:hypothetical protein